MVKNNIFKNVKIMHWGLNRNNFIYKKQKVKFPRECFVSINFDNSRIIGVAKRFRNKDDGIYCDIKFDRENLDYKTIAPTLLAKSCEEVKDGKIACRGLSLESVSTVLIHSCKECDNNLTSIKKE